MKKVFAVGIGPGCSDMMTLQARKTLESCEAIYGYTVYIDLIRDIFPDKRYVTTGMRAEKERCRLALEEADRGTLTAVVCSGDAGVYGMAGLLLELGEAYPEVSIEIVPGVTAALSGAAVLGAPLGHDFCVISLSDLLTPMELIEKRIECAAMADMAMAIYNPSSKKRADYLRRTCDIILKHQPEELVCGYVKNIGRDGECCRIMTLGQLKDEELDMFTTVFIGNSATRRINERMVTPRGYRE